jgi:hypothetical protein
MRLATETAIQDKPATTEGGNTLPDSPEAVTRADADNRFALNIELRKSR